MSDQHASPGPEPVPPRTPSDGAAPTAPRRPGSARRLFATTVLVCESFVVFFAALVAYGLQLADTAVVTGTAAAAAILCLLAVPLLRRGTVGYALGTVVQVGLLLSGIVIPMMLVLGIVFTALWVVAWRTGGRIDVERRERYEAELARTRGDVPA